MFRSVFTCDIYATSCQPLVLDKIKTKCSNIGPKAHSNIVEVLVEIRRN